MKTRLCVLFFGITLPLLCMAQSNIGGCVREEQNKVLPNANVMFYQKDSLVAGIVTDKKGCFSLRLNAGKYQMHILYLGYNEYTDSIQLPQNGLTLTPIVMKKSAAELQEVVISGANTYEAQQNKTIFNVSSQIKRSSSDVYQVLSHVPMLAVDLIEKNIKQLVGSDNFVVMVNNIRRDKGYLLTIRPENVDRVEIIRNPGARYSSKNIDGIVNIVTKSPVSGQSGYVSGLLNPKFSSFDAGYTHVGEKLNISLSGQEFFFNEKKRDISMVRDVYSEEKPVHTEKQSNRTDFKMNSLYLSPTFDYTFSPKAYLTLSANYINSPQKVNRPYTGSVWSSNQKMYDFTATDKSNSQYEKYGINPYFQIKPDKNRTISMEMDYTSVSTNNNSSYTELQNTGSSYINNQLTGDSQKNLDAQINYWQKIKKIDFEGGYRTYWQNNNFHKELDGVPNSMKYSEWRNYFYANILGELGKNLSYQAGIGFDMVRTKINETFTHSYSELTPNAMLRYKINKSQNMTLDYMRMRQSPSFSYLNPLPLFVDSTRIITGNPELTPYYTNRLRLSFEWMKNKYYVWAAIQYRFANNYITTKEQLDENGTYHITYANAAHYSSTSFMLNFSVNVLKGWKIMANGAMEYRTIEDKYQLQFNKQYWALSLWVMSMINYKSLSVNFSYFPYFRTPTLTGYMKIAGESSLMANYNLNRHWSIKGGVRYLFPMIYKSETYTDGFTEIYRDNMTDRYLRLFIGAQYSFQTGKQKSYKQKGSKNYNDNADTDDKKVY